MLPFVLAALASFSARLSAQPIQNPAVVADSLGAHIDSALSGLAAQGLSGAILVLRNRSVVFQKGYGFANRGTRARFTAATVTQIGSNTKDFTAVAILQLVEAGKLHLEDSISRLFPNVPADKAPITVANLLERTAGLPEYSGGDFDPVTQGQFLAHIFASKLRSPVGAEEHYSNPGFSLLAAIIERVSGTTYDVYVRDNILNPLGLHDTGFLLPGFDPTRMAHGYSGGTDDGTILDKPHAADGPYWNLRGNGGMLSTMNDMYRFYTDLFDSEKLLRRSTRGRFFPSDQPIGLAGGDGVSFFLYERDPRSSIEFIIASNSNDVRGRSVRDVLASALGMDGRRESPVASAALGPEPTLPETAAGAAFQRYRDAFNTGDTTAMVRLLAEHFAPNPSAPPLAQRVANYRRVFGIIGAFRPIRIEASEANRITVVALSKAGDEVAITVNVEPDAPHRILAVRVERR